VLHSAAPVTISFRDVKTKAIGGMRGFAPFELPIDQASGLLTVIQGICSMTLATTYLKRAETAHVAG